MSSKQTSKAAVALFKRACSALLTHVHRRMSAPTADSVPQACVRSIDEKMASVPLLTPFGFEIVYEYSVSPLPIHSCARILLPLAFQEPDHLVFKFKKRHSLCCIFQTLLQNSIPHTNILNRNTANRYCVCFFVAKIRSTLVLLITPFVGRLSCRIFLHTP